MAFDTAANIVASAAKEMGLVTAAPVNPFASTDPHIIQLLEMLRNVGEELARAHPWSQLQKTHTFPTEAAVSSYALPVDYARTIDQTHWNRTTGWPLLGPIGAVGWGYLQSAMSGVTSMYSGFRVMGPNLHVFPTPSSVQTVAFDYISNSWVQASVEDLLPTASAITAASDILWFDRLLLIRALQLAFKTEKGFDTTGAVDNYNQAYALAVGADTVAPVLSLVPREAPCFISWCNAPPGNWGL